MPSNRAIRQHQHQQQPTPGGATSSHRAGASASHRSEKWREQRDRGALGALEPKPRGLRPPSADAVENVKLRGELDRAQADLKTARRVIEVQGNVSALLEELLTKRATETDERRP
jgi:transposase